MKDLIAGSLGRLDDAGGSSMFAVPRTIYVPPEYEIETDVPGVAEFVTCSLDGRLWIWRRSRRYYVAVFRWNDETQRLEFVSTTILNGESVVKRGVDWILTDKSFILSSDNEPYISRTEYASDDTSYIDAINRCYSFFPELETWEYMDKLHLKNFPYGKLADENIFFNMKQYGSYTYQPQICYCDDRIFAKYRNNRLTGATYITPYTFTQAGQAKDFFINIRQDYLTGNASDSLVPFDSSPAVVSFANNNNNVCKEVQDAKMYALSTSTEKNFNATGECLFYDAMSQSYYAFSDERASFVQDDSCYDCSALKQWVMPSENIEELLPETVISNIDNFMLVTHFQQGLYREVLLKKELPVSIKNFSDKNLSIGDTSNNSYKAIHINSIHANCKSIAADWQKIYCPYVDIKLVSALQEINYPKNDGRGLIISTERITGAVSLIQNSAHKTQDYGVYAITYGREYPPTEFPYYEYYGVPKGQIGYHCVGQDTMVYRLLNPDTGAVETISVTLNKWQSVSSRTDDTSIYCDTFPGSWTDGYLYIYFTYGYASDDVITDSCSINGDKITVFRYNASGGGSYEDISMPDFYSQYLKGNDSISKKAHCPAIEKITKALNNEKTWIVIRLNLQSNVFWNDGTVNFEIDEIYQYGRITSESSVGDNTSIINISLNDDEPYYIYTRSTHIVRSPSRIYAFCVTLNPELLKQFLIEGSENQ